MGLCTSSAPVGDAPSSSSSPRAGSAATDAGGFTNLRDASVAAKKNTAAFLRVVAPQLAKAVKAYHCDRQDTKSNAPPLALVLDHPLHGKRPAKKHKKKSGAGHAGPTKFEDSHVEVLVGINASSSPLISGLTATARPDDDNIEGTAEWEEITGENGRNYYYCPSTGETTWDKPPGFCSAACAVISISGHVFTTLDAVARMLQWPQISTLTTLRLEDNAIGDEGVAVLAEALMSPSCCRLKLLHLDGNRIGDSGCQALALALRESTLALRTLKLDRQKKTRITLVGVTAFADSLSRATCRLEILSFSGNKSVDCACAGKLAEAVQSRRGEHSALTELYLSGTSVSDAGASQLAPVLYLLSTVSLSGCRIGDDGGKALANALKAAQRTKQPDGGVRLKGCDLQGNYFHPETVAALMDAAPPGCMLAVSAGSGSTMA